MEEGSYALRNLKGGGMIGHNSDSLVVILALSGGGFRAAALAHAVMEAMAATPIYWEGRVGTLFDEVDVISSVSGGSLAAAYFALHPDAFLKEFPSRVLGLDLQGAVLQHTLSPSGLWRQTSNTFGRGDLLQEVLDERIFHGLTFRAVPRRRPMVYINATDMRYGQRFEFTQDQFDHLCSNLDEFPVARAVAASMAVPVLFSPITVWNHRANCPSPRMLRPVSGHAANSKFVHLVDGGLADNTGLNGILDNVAVNGGVVQVEKNVQLLNVRKRVIISVNAQVVPLDSDADSARTPSLVRQLRSLVNVPIDRHSDAKLLNLAEAVRQWQAELQTATGQSFPIDTEPYHLIDFNLSRANSTEMDETLQQIPTGLRIEPHQVEQIRQFVRNEIAANLEWRNLLVKLGHSPAPSTDVGSN